MEGGGAGREKEGGKLKCKHGYMKVAEQSKVANAGGGRRERERERKGRGSKIGDEPGKCTALALDIPAAIWLHVAAVLLVVDVAA